MKNDNWPIRSGKPSIRTKALSRAHCSRPVFVVCTAWRPEVRVSNKISGHHALITSMKLFIAPSPIDSAQASSHDCSCEHPAAGPVRKWETLRFPRRPEAPSSARVSLDARALIQYFGLARADHDFPRAALDVCDFRIADIGAQHPVKSHG